MIKRLLSAPLILFCAVCSAEPPTESSIEYFLVLSGAQRMMEEMVLGMTPVIRQGTERYIAARGLNPEQQQRIPEILKRVDTLVLKEFAWEVAKPAYIQATRESLTQEEVNAAIAFYASALGRSIVAKTPAMMQRANELGQQQMRDAMPRLRAETEKIIAEAGLPFEAQ